MSSWRVERHYGFGAARIPIQPEPHRVAEIGLAEGVGILVGELTEGGVVATLRRAAGEASAIGLSLLILAAVVVTLMRDYSDLSSIEVVLFETVVPRPVTIIDEVEESVPVEIAKPEPPKRVAPRPKPPPPTRIAERPKPPPPPVAKPKPRSRPKPVILRIASVEAPKPPLLQKPARAVRERPVAIARPRVAIEAARPKPSPTTPRSDRIARTPVGHTNPAHLAPRLDAPAAPALALPPLAEQREAPPRRAFRVASAKPAPGHPPRALPEIALASHPIATPPTTRGPRPARTSGPRPAAPRPPRGPAATLSAPPVAMASRVPAATPRRAARPARATSPRRAPRPAAPLAAVTPLLEPTMPTPASRPGRAAPDLPRGPTGDPIGVAGVPLGELASCLSDREEDRLKQAVVAAVTTQAECVSSKGTYRFVETKNLNAFLMWIDRDPARSVADRCVELGYALECLRSTRRRAAR